MSLYLACTCGHEGHANWFPEPSTETGKKLDITKSCVPFKKVEDLALDLLAEAIRRVLAKDYRACRGDAQCVGQVSTEERRQTRQAGPGANGREIRQVGRDEAPGREVTVPRGRSRGHSRAQLGSGQTWNALRTKSVAASPMIA
jgi:hypothetical protein